MSDGECTSVSGYSYHGGRGGSAKWHWMRESLSEMSSCSILLEKLGFTGRMDGVVGAELLSGAKHLS